MNKKKAIQLLKGEGWSEADSKRVLKLIDFKTNSHIDEITLFRAASKFAGAELLQRQYNQRGQKIVVTKRNKEILKHKAHIKTLEKKIDDISLKTSPDLKKQIEELKTKNNQLIIEIEELIIKNNKSITPNNELIAKINELTKQNNELVEVNKSLKKDNRALKNIVDAIKLKFTIETEHLLKLENSEIKKGLVKLIKSTLG